jgi:DNA repair protein RadC
MVALYQSRHWQQALHHQAFPDNILHISIEDIAVTKEIVKSGKLLDIDVLDHMVIGGANARFVSLKERGLGF